MSSTITTDKKDYRELLRRQINTEIDLSALKEAVLELSRDIVRPAVVKRLEKRSRILDRGGGKRFSNLGELRGCLKGL